MILRAVLSFPTLMTINVLMFNPPTALGYPESNPPNVIYIMADELGYYELSCMGHPHHQTPNIDQMAAEGLRFTQCLAGSSVCAPTRCCLMTGKHSGHTSVRSNGGGTPLRAGEETIASVVKAAGYATGGFGKWGCGGRGSTGVPEQHGFDRFLGYYDQVHAHSYYPAYIVNNSEEWPLQGNRGGSKGETYSHYVIFEEAMAFIRENRDRSFFCYMPVTPPHGLFDIPDSDPAWTVFKDEDWPEPARRFAAMVHMVDRQVGEVLALLRELELEENTIVFFCGDNGGNDYFRDREHPRGFHAPNVDPKSGREFRGTKGKLYEGGLRIPMVVRWPGRIAGNRVSDLVCSFPDILPTLAELCSAEAPDDIDGISLVPELLGEEAAGRAQEGHEFLYWELGSQVAVRMDSWKAIRPGKNRDWELYDLSVDISETDDLAKKHPSILEKMKGFASESHTPVETGTFHDREIHEKDRRAKWGDQEPNRRKLRPKHTMPREGLIPRESYRIVRVSSENEGNGKLGKMAFDADASTWWHTRFRPEVDGHPHEWILDLGATKEVEGLRYLARQDGSWNGTIGEFELFVGEDAENVEDLVVRGRFEKVRRSQERLGNVARGRYVRLVIHSEVNGGPWASAAELGLVGKR